MGRGGGRGSDVKREEFKVRFWERKGIRDGGDMPPKFQIT